MVKDEFRDSARNSMAHGKVWALLIFVNEDHLGPDHDERLKSTSLSAILEGGVFYQSIDAAATRLYNETYTARSYS